MKRKSHIKAEKLRSDILRILRKNARKKIVDIAKELGVVSSTVLHHIKEMESDGTIKGYTALSHHEEMSKLKAVILIKTKPPLIRQVAEHISKINEVLLLFEGSITPTINIFCFAHANNPEHLSEILFQIRHIEGVEHVESHVLTRKIKEKFLSFH